MRVRFRCPVCEQVILAPPSLVGRTADCPKCGETVDEWPRPLAPKPKRPDIGPRRGVLWWDRLTLLQQGTVIGGAGILILLVALGIADLVAPTRTIEASQEDWILVCKVTGRGTETYDEGFSGRYLENMEFQRGVRMDRVYPGTRVRAAVFVDRRYGDTPTGNCLVFGTVTRVDVLDKKVWLTDCVFR